MKFKPIHKKTRILKQQKRRQNEDRLIKTVAPSAEARLHAQWILQNGVARKHENNLKPEANQEKEPKPNKDNIAKCTMANAGGAKPNVVFCLNIQMVLLNSNTNLQLRNTNSNLPNMSNGTKTAVFLAANRLHNAFCKIAMCYANRHARTS